MARGIEHRSTEGVLDAYRLCNEPNFAIFSGSEIMMGYDLGDLNNGESTLSDMLNVLEQGGSSTTFTLRIYAPEAKNITNKTPYKASTTFMLNGNQGVKNENGVMVIDRGNAPVNNAGNTAIMNRLDSLEKTNRDLQERLHKEEIKNLEQKFEQRIAGLQKQDEEKPDVWTRIGESLLEKPDRMDKLIETFGNVVGGLVGLINGKKDFIVNRQPAPVQQVNGTQKTPPPMENETEQIPVTAEGAYVNPYLTDAEKQEKKSKQYELMQQRLKEAQQEELDNQQMVCIEVLEKRISPVTVTHLLILVASMDDEDLNKLLNNMS